MRKKLKELGSEQRHRFIGKVQKFGYKNSYCGIDRTICLVEIKLKDTEEIITDHLWLTVGKQMKQLELKENDIISFDARVDNYWKGYMGRRDDVFDKPVELDYKLSFPTKFKVENREVIIPKRTRQKRQEQPKPISYKNLLQLEEINEDNIFDFGKHKGKTISQVIEEDLGYLLWFRNELDNDFKKQNGFYQFLYSERMKEKLQFQERREDMRKYTKRIQTSLDSIERALKDFKQAYPDITFNLNFTIKDKDDDIFHIEKDKI